MRDDIDYRRLYHMRFERYSRTQGWPVENYAMCLETLLTGKVLEVYSRIPLTLTNDFEHSKAPPLNRFQMTCDDFRQ